MLRLLWICCSRLLLAMILLAAALPAQSGRLNLADPDDAVRAMRKLQSWLEDGKPAIYWFQGSVYSRVPGERDRLLFTYQAMNIRASATTAGPETGYGYKHVSREILLYMDPATRRILRTWKNPWTGKEVEVVHVANDPVNSQVSARGPRGNFRFEPTFKDGMGFYSLEVPLLYTNPLGGDYQEYVGGAYHAMEMFNFFFDEEELLGPTTGVEHARVSWARVSSWLPWMEMGDRPGILIYNGVGRRISGWDLLPQELRAEIEARYPEYRNPPPLDDNRPNETSWTYFKKWIDAKRKKP